MATGWVAQGPDGQAPDPNGDPWKPQGPDADANAQPGIGGSSTPGPSINNPWAPTGPDAVAPETIARRHQDPNAHPIQNTHSLMDRTRDFIMGSDKTPGIVPAIGSGLDELHKNVNDWETGGPGWGEVASAVPGAVKANVQRTVAGGKEAIAASGAQTNARTALALQVLPQVAARTSGQGYDQVQKMAKDPAVQAAAQKLGMDPEEFAGEWTKYSYMSPDQQAGEMRKAQAALPGSLKSLDTARQARYEAGAQEKLNRPANLDPWSLKGLAFETAVGVPKLATIVGGTAAGTALGGPAGGVAAGAGTSMALFAPEQYSQAQDKIDARLDKLRSIAADSEGPQKQSITAQADDLEARRDSIAGTAGFLYAASDAAGALPVSSVLARTPAGKAVLDRIVGSTLSQSVGGRVAGAAVANGAGGMLQASIQQAVDHGVIHTDTPLSDALKDIAFTGVTSALTAVPVAGAHEGIAAARTRGQFTEADAADLRARRANFNMGGEEGAATSGTQPGAGTGGGGASASPYPGYEWGTQANGREGWVPTGAATSGKQQGALPAPKMADAYQDKVDAVNAAAAKAESRSDVQLVPSEKEGWEIHVGGEPVATFATAANAREVLAQARKVVGTNPPKGETETASGATKGAEPATKPVESETQTPAPSAAAEAPPAPSNEEAAAATAASGRRQQLRDDTDRRQDVAQRKKVADMSPDELKASLLTNELTGIPNRRAYEESEKLPVQASADVDSLKWVNDNAGHGAGDEMLKAVAKVLHEETGGNAYHMSGDEFVIQGHDHDSLEDQMYQARQRLAEAKLEFTGPKGDKITLNGVGLSHGAGASLDEAEQGLQAEKAFREREGLRASRGEQPPGASVAPREGGVQTDQGHGAAQEVGAPEKPVALMHGLGFARENKAGSVRAYTDPDGTRGQRQMKDDYGFLTDETGKPIKAADGEGLDAFRGPDANASHVYVIDQKNPDKSFDEHKVMTQYGSEAEAKAAYARNYQKGWKGLGAITALPTKAFAHWVKHGDLTEPLAYSRGHDNDNTTYIRHGDQLHEMAQRAGWDELGGRLIREVRSDGLKPEVIGRTKNLPREPWFGLLQKEGAMSALPGNSGGEATRKAVAKAIAGKKLGDRQRAHLNAMVDVVRAKSMDPADLAKLTDDELAEREALLRKIGGNEVAEEFKLYGGTMPPRPKPGEKTVTEKPKGHQGLQTDLFGDKVAIANELEKIKAERARRQANAPAPESSAKPDLFNSASKQTDLEDAPTTDKGVVRKPTTLTDITEAGEGAALKDAGEKIGGARKDVWAARGLQASDLANMSDGEAAKLVTKANVWKPDYGAMIAKGATTPTVALLKVLYDKLGAGPKQNTPVGRQNFVEAMSTLRGLVDGMDLKSVSDLKGLEDAFTQAIGWDTKQGMRSHYEPSPGRDKFWSIQKGRHSSLRVMNADIRKATALVEDGFPNIEPWKRRFEIIPTGDNRFLVVAKGNRKRIGDPHASKADAETAAAAAYEETKGKGGDAQEPVRPHLDNIERTGLPDRRQRPATAQDFVNDFGFRGIEFGNWAANDERQRLVNMAYDGLHDLANVLGVSPKALSLGGRLGLALGARGMRFAAHYEPGKMVINMAKETGAGSLAHEWAHAVDHYFGELNRPDAYQTDARGGSGWYTPGARPNPHMREAMQKAWAGVSEAMFRRERTKAESVRNLELELERREKSNAYQRTRLANAEAMPQPDQRFIRDMKGYLDGDDKRLDATRRALAGLREQPETPGGYGKVESSYFQHAKGLSGKAAEKGYWARPTEMWARAFESYVFDRLKAQQAKSEYLVQGVEPDRFTVPPYKGNPYPAEDRPRINAAIDHLVKTLEEGPDHALREPAADYVASRRKAYNDQQFTLDLGGGKQTVTPEFETRPDTRGDQVAAGSAFLRSLIGYGDRRAGARVLANAVTKDFVERGHTSLIGKQVTGPADLALMAQVYRDPRVETLRFFLTKADTIVEQTGISSRMPGGVHFGDQMFADLANLMHTSGADGYYLLHNHPSGNGESSIPDRIATANFAQRVPGLKSHVVIDHNEWSEIGPQGDSELHRQRFGGYKPLENPRVEHPLLGIKIGGAAEFAQFAQTLEAVDGKLGENRAAVIATDAQGRVVAIADLPVSRLAGGSGARDRLKRIARIRKLKAAGGAGGHVFAIANNIDHVIAGYESGLFTDIIQPGDEYTHQMGASERHGTDSALLGRHKTLKVNEEKLPYNASPFYSRLLEAATQAGREKGTAAEWLGTLKNMPGVKQDELDYTGLKDWLEGRGRVAKADVVDYLNAHQIHIGEAVHGTPIPPSEEGLAKRKEIFDRHAPAIEALQRKLDSVIAADAGRVRGDAANLARWDLERARAERDIEADNAYEIPEAKEAEFSQYRLPGGENYRELLMTLPTQDQVSRVPMTNPPGWGGGPAEDAGYIEYGNTNADFRAGHFDEPNVLAHVRFDDRTGPNGERILHLAEVQSDWHQQGRKKGYSTNNPALTRRVVDILAQKIAPNRKFLPAHLKGSDHEGQRPIDPGYVSLADVSHWEQKGVVTADEGSALREYVEEALHLKPPDAPYKTTWPELALKRMIRFAAEHGYDKLSWDTGDTSAARYDLSKHLDSIMWHKDGHVTPLPNGKFRLSRPGLQDELFDSAEAAEALNYYYSVQAYDHDQNRVFAKHLRANELEQYVGKDMAARIVEEGKTKSSDVLHGLDLKVGGEGMREFYDKLLPNAANKLVKKFGAKVGRDVLQGIKDPQYEQPLQVATHSIDITPELRAGVSRGFAVFEEPPKYDATQVHTNGPTYDTVRKVVQAVPSSEFVMAFRRILDPANVSDLSQATASIARAKLGELAHDTHESQQLLERFAKAFDVMSPADRYQFIDDIEEGRKQTIAELQPAADAIRQMFDTWRDKIRDLGTGALENFIENYFPHIWQDPKQARKAFAAAFGRRPMTGSRAFLKERTIPTTREGLALGLQPVSSNPLILSFIKIREMQRYYTGIRLMESLKDAGLARFFRAGKPLPEAWKPIEDAVARVRQWSEEEGGFVDRGRYAMPEDAARVINNHLSGSALANFAPAQVFRIATNAMNALQLGFSAFHLGFTTLDAVISKGALAVERLANGEPMAAMRALTEYATGPVAAGMNVRRGMQLLKAYSNPGGATPLLQAIVSGLESAGGRVSMDTYFRSSTGESPFHGVGFWTLGKDIRAALTLPSGKFAAVTKELTSFPLQYATRLWRDLQGMWQEMPRWMIPVEVAGRTTRASTAWIMEHVVPLQKLGVFSDMAADIIRRNPGVAPEALAKEMQAAWNSVDNRLGEMVYDNVFWNRTFKDVTHFAVRAVGWNLGTIRELGGAPVDVLKVLDWAAGKAGQKSTPETRKFGQVFGHKIAYTISLTATTMILGAIINKLFGQTIDEVKDYFFPKTGRTTKYGTPERMSMPTYTKDIYEYAHQPATTLFNKANPLFSTIHDIWANEDFYGGAIRDPDDTTLHQVLQSAAFAARESMPFAIQGTKQFAGGGALLESMPYVGFTPAPARVTSPEVMEHYQHQRDEQAYLKTLNRQLRAAKEAKDHDKISELEKQIQEQKQRAKGTGREIKQDKTKAREAAAKISAVISGKPHAAQVAALREAGMPAFAELWNAMPQLPRPRVAESLATFA